MLVKPKFPMKVQQGSVTVQIYRQCPSKEYPDYHTYTLTYYEDGQRKRTSFSGLQAAQEEAEAVAERISRGHGNALVLRNSDQLEYVRAKEALSPLGVHLDMAAVEYAQALSILNGKGSLIEAARYFTASCAGEIIPMQTQDLVADLLKAREANHASERHIKDLRLRLNRFAKGFKCEVHLIRPAQVQDFLLSLKLSPRSINNYPRRKKDNPSSLTRTAQSWSPG